MAKKHKKKHHKERYVVKASKEKEQFLEEKLFRSLQKAGAPKDLAHKIVEHIKRELPGKMTTRQIYKHAFDLLLEEKKPIAAKYNLKRAIRDLGPTGGPFELLIGELFRAQGYKVKVGEIISGTCVDHEMDVIAEKGGKQILVECKFHNHPGIKSNIKVALYVHARFQDIEKKCDLDGRPHKFHEIWLATNTRFTKDAMRYAKCNGIKVIGWDYPPENSLVKLIEKYELYPITTLTSLSQYYKNKIIERGIILCKDLMEKEYILNTLHLSKEQKKKVLDEVRELCS